MTRGAAAGAGVSFLRIGAVTSLAIREGDGADGQGRGSVWESLGLAQRLHGVGWGGAAFVSAVGARGECGHRR